MENIALLKKIDIFSNLSSYELAKIGKLLKSREFKEGEFVVKEGEVGDSLFVIKKGTVRVASSAGKGNKGVLALLGEGDHFGEIALLDNLPRSADVIANEASSLLEIRREELEGLLSAAGAIAIKIYKAFATSLGVRLRETNENLLLLKKDKD